MGESSRSPDPTDHSCRRCSHVPLSLPRSSTRLPRPPPTPLLPRDLSLTLFVAPAFFGISAPADNRAEAGAPSPNPSGFSPQPSRSILSWRAVEWAPAPEAPSAPAHAACGSDPEPAPLLRLRGRHLPAGGSKMPRSNRACAGPSRPGQWPRRPRDGELGSSYVMPHTPPPVVRLCYLWSFFFMGRKDKECTAPGVFSLPQPTSRCGWRAQHAGVDRASCCLSPWVVHVLMEHPPCQALGIPQLYRGR